MRYLDQCTNSNYKIEENVCCRFCKCSLSYLEPNFSLFKIDNSQTVIDLSNYMKSTRAFKCDEVDHYNECEVDCRQSVKNLLNYDKIESIEIESFLEENLQSLEIEDLELYL